ncbi:4651_t:CDS:2 [Entrophospora sp. SA101]|nr:4651_t:CDS:2 [Entrophospora sp. SA101]
MTAQNTILPSTTTNIDVWHINDTLDLKKKEIIKLLEQENSQESLESSSSTSINSSSSTSSTSFTTMNKASSSSSSSITRYWK